MHARPALPLSPACADEDIAAEIRQYLDDAMAAGIARGLTPPKTRAGSRELEIGNRRLSTNRCARTDGKTAYAACLFDLRYAVRQLRMHRGFSHRQRHHARPRHRRQHGDLQRR